MSLIGMENLKKHLNMWRIGASVLYHTSQGGLIEAELWRQLRTIVWL